MPDHNEIPDEAVDALRLALDHLGLFPEEVADALKAVAPFIEAKARASERAAALSLEGEGEIARHEQLIDEANRSDLRAHDRNRLRRLGELADAMAAAIEAWQAGISPGANSFTEAEADLMGRVAEYREATTAEGWNGVIWPNAEVYFAILLDDNEVKAIYVNGKERPDLLNGSAGEENK